MHDSLFRKRDFLGRLTAAFVVLTLLLALVPPVPVSAADGALDSTFDPGTGANNTVNAVIVQPDGKIIIVGAFTNYNGTGRNRIARLNADGSLDTTFDPGTGANNTIIVAALQPDGKILIGGSFTTFRGTGRNRIARINADGTLDTTFTVGTGANSTVNAIVRQPDGKILIGGAFTSYAGTAINRLARLTSTGGLDATFAVGVGANNSISSMALQPDGNLVIAGAFTTYDGSASIRLARVTSAGAFDSTFVVGAGANLAINRVILQPDGKVIIGGNFTSYAGTGRNRIARVTATGALDTTFVIGTGANNNVNSLALQSDGKVLVGGAFTSFAGVARSRIARLSSTGALDTTFVVGTGANGTVSAIATQPDNRILIGGAFTTYNDTARNRIARLYYEMPPTNITLSSQAILENEPVGATVGTLTTTDPNPLDTFIYTLVDTAGCAGPGNSAFSISSSSLQTAAVLDFETQSSYTICVRSTDSFGLTFDKQFTITVTNANEAPTGIALSASLIAENLPAGTTVGQLSVTDQDAGDSAAYTLVDTAGCAGPDNAAFSISGSSLQTAASFDFETQSSYTICVQAEDSGALAFTRQFTIIVTDENEAPTSIALSVSLVAENQPIGTIVGQLSATDPDAGDTFTFSLVDTVGCAGPSNAAFSISGSSLLTAASFDFETQNSYTICVQGEDSGGLSNQRQFVITITEENDAPTVNESTFSISENSPDGTVVGVVTYSDPDAGQSGVCSITSGNTGDVFAINPTTCSLTVANNAALDFETNPVFLLTIRVTDNGVPPLYDEGIITVQLNNSDEAPVITEGDSVDVTMDEDGSPTSFDLTLHATDADVGDVLTWGISVDAGNGLAAAVGTGFTKAVAYAPNGDYNGTDSFEVTVTDPEGFTDAITVNVIIRPVNDAPVNNVPGLPQFTLENAVLVFSGTVGNAIFVSDVDLGSDDIRISLTAAHGVLTLNGKAGLVFITGDGVGDPSVIFTAALADANNALNGLQFTPDAGFNGTATLELVSNDQSSGGALTDTDTVQINVGPVPPRISDTGIDTVTGTGDGSLSEGEIATVRVIRILVTFDQDVYNPDGNTQPDDVTSPANYLLLRRHSAAIQTTSCTQGVQPGDEAISIDSVTYSNNGGKGPFTAVLQFNQGRMLPSGVYRLIVCGSTSIVDLNNVALAGDGQTPGTDFIRNFSIMQPEALPVTGFAPADGFVTPQPYRAMEPADSSDLWLEIPALGVKLPIVGVPLTQTGWDVSWLGRDAGWLEGTAFPTWEGNSVITAHVWDRYNQPGPFLGLRGLKRGDVVQVRAWGQVYTFQVRQNFVVEPDEIDQVLQHEDESWLTLLTCEDYDALLSGYNYRRVVRAQLLSVQDVK